MSWVRETIPLHARDPRDSFGRFARTIPLEALWTPQFKKLIPSIAKDLSPLSRRLILSLEECVQRVKVLIYVWGLPS